MIFSIFKASGHSMSPKIKDNSFFVASSIPYIFYKPKTGDIILFKNNNKNIVKKINKIENDRIFVKGENKLDSKEFSPILKNEIMGKVILIF